MRQSRAALLLLGVALACIVAPSHGFAQTRGELHAGVRGGYDGTEGTLAFLEALVSIDVGDWPIRPELGLAGASDTVGSQWDLLVGARLDVARFLSFGGGLDLISDDLATERVLGGYVRGTLAAPLTDSFGLGVDGRMSFAPDATSIYGERRDVDYTQWSIFLRFGL